MASQRRRAIGDAAREESGAAALGGAEHIAGVERLEVSVAGEGKLEPGDFELALGVLDALLPGGAAGRVMVTDSAGGREGALRDELVFVDQAAEQVSAADAIEVDHLDDRLLAAWRRRAERWPLYESAVRAVLVVMRDIHGENALEVAAADDQDSVEALSAHRADPAFGVRPRLWRPYRRLDHPHPLGAEDLVEVACGLCCLDHGPGTATLRHQAATCVIRAFGIHRVRLIS